jgi:hypothetical protein
LEGNLGLLLSKTTSWVNTSGAAYTCVPTMCICNDEVSVLLAPQNQQISLAYSLWGSLGEVSQECLKA